MRELRKNLFFLCMLVMAAAGMVACSDSDDDNGGDGTGAISVETPGKGDVATT